MVKVNKILQVFGENIRLARLRRKLSMSMVAKRAGISRSTLWMIEKGTPTVSIGSYAYVLFVLGLENDLAIVGKDDILGRKLQDAGLKIGKRSPKKVSK